MSALLHLGALVPAAVGVCALAGMRAEAGRPELAAAALMLVGMTDAMTVSLLPPVAWFAALVAAGLLLAAARRVRPVTGARPHAMLSAHLALGMISTAVLILLMPSMPSMPSAVPPSAHGHGGSAAMPAVLGAGLAVGTVVLAVVALRRERSWLPRVHHATMTASTVAMCAIVAL